MCCFLSSRQHKDNLRVDPFCSLLDALAKLRKTIICFVTSVCLSFRLSVCPCFHMEELGTQWTDFDEIWCLIIFRKSVEKIQVSFVFLINEITIIIIWLETLEEYPFRGWSLCVVGLWIPTIIWILFSSQNSKTCKFLEPARPWDSKKQDPVTLCIRKEQRSRSFSIINLDSVNVPFGKPLWILSVISCVWRWLFVGAFTKLWKATNNFFTPRSHGTTRLPLDGFH